MEKTENLGLNLPGEEDYYSIDDFNENARIIDAVLNPDLIDEAFEKYFPGLSDDPDPEPETDPDEEQDTDVMSSASIEEAINTEWDGSSSSDPDAMSSDSIEEALSTQWNGEASEDPDAMTPTEINDAISSTT